MTKHTVFDSPIGQLTIVGDGATITGLYMDDHSPAPDPSRFGERDDEAFADAREQLGEYFAGEREAFELALEPSGTSFQQRVWAQLRAIPFGQTRTYGEIAAAIGQPTAVRAVGLANGRNPISIVVPCHRVVGSTGKLTGYAGGLERKRRLLDLECGLGIDSVA